MALAEKGNFFAKQAPAHSIILEREGLVRVPTPAYPCSPIERLCIIKSTAKIHLSSELVFSISMLLIYHCECCKCRKTEQKAIR